MKELTLIKLGGSVITHKGRAYKSRKKIIERLALELKRGLRFSKGKFLIGHGSGSFGHYAAYKYKIQEGQKKKGFDFGVCKVSEAAINLNRIVISSFLEKGLAVFPFYPSSFILLEDKKIKSFFVEQIKTALGFEMIPVVMGDILIDTKRKAFIYSTEMIFSFLIENLYKDFRDLRVIHIGDTKGVYDDQGRVIKMINKDNFSIYERFLRKSEKKDVTGGMSHKVKESLSLSERFGIKTYIISGLVKDNLYNLLTGKGFKGTLIA